MLAGSIFMFAGSTAPEGFLICDGSAVSRTTYSTLYDAIGDTYGSGDGSTTFNVPDLVGKVAIGVSSTYLLGSTGGEETHSLTSTEMPTHGHTIPSHGHANTILATTPQLSHTITQPAFNYNKPNGTLKNANYGIQAYNGTSSVNATRSADLKIANHAAASCTMGGGISDCSAFDTQNTGSGTTHNNMQPYITLNYVIATGE